MATQARHGGHSLRGVPLQPSLHPSSSHEGTEVLVQRRNLVLIHPTMSSRVTEGQGHREHDRTRLSHGYFRVAVMASSSQLQEGRSMTCIQRGAPTFLLSLIEISKTRRDNPSPFRKIDETEVRGGLMTG